MSGSSYLYIVGGEVHQYDFFGKKFDVVISNLEIYAHIFKYIHMAQQKIGYF